VIAYFKRRQLFVHPIQYWFVATTLVYFSCLLVVLYGVVFLPMVQPLDSPTVSWEERAQVATQILELNTRVWPWLLVTFLGLLLHSLYFMHRIAGPLYRFAALFRSIGAGHLHQRARLRKHDYLHREARDFNAMLDSLEHNIALLHRHGTAVSQTYQDAVRPIRQQSSNQLNAALQMLEADISRLRLCADTFKPKETQQSASQLPLEFTDRITEAPTTKLKAA
jgi:methyl-accepting chemotaxis protein